MKAIRAIIAAVADLLRVGRVPIARGASHSQPGHHTGSIAHHNISNWRSHRGEEFSYLDRIHLRRLFTVGRATLSFSLVLVWFDGVARIAGSSRIARTARSGGR